MVEEQLPILDTTVTSTYLKTASLNIGSLSHVEFKKLYLIMALKVADYPWNAQIALDVSLPLAKHQAIMRKKFKDLDNILAFCVRVPQWLPNSPLLRKYGEMKLSDIVTLYTGYAMRASGKFIPINSVLGTNINLQQLLVAVVETLESDDEFFLTNSVSLNDENMNLLVCRFYAIAEALATSRIGVELLLSENSIGTILTQMDAFLQNVVYHQEQASLETIFSGLKSDHLKILLAGVVLLDTWLARDHSIWRTMPSRETPRKLLNRPLRGIAPGRIRFVRVLVETIPGRSRVVTTMVSRLVQLLVNPQEAEAARQKLEQEDSVVRGT